ncbi:hypothetical protein A8926_4532 [Saccharopolyspora spinosa]|uniref:Uncharacterized protein n=1 Tax=Saccharopolyspora spinosa TaxID=60894 RepID=A0A2N3Y186_SACSN|nr:hypothetical protein A8926_4532 [Saccharopolyspora spinosa]
MWEEERLGVRLVLRLSLWLLSPSYPGSGGGTRR